jgi:hypothetical protein
VTPIRDQLFCSADPKRRRAADGQPMSNGSGAIGMGVDHAAPFAAAAGHAGFGQVPTATYYPPTQVMETRVIRVIVG